MPIYLIHENNFETNVFLVGDFWCHFFQIILSKMSVYFLTNGSYSALWMCIPQLQRKTAATLNTDVSCHCFTCTHVVFSFHVLLVLVGVQNLHTGAFLCSECKSVNLVHVQDTVHCIQHLCLVMSRRGVAMDHCCTYVTEWNQSNPKLLQWVDINILNILTWTELDVFKQNTDFSLLSGKLCKITLAV